ncbi:MAG: type 1 glutamine amidotransferase domain-containing protein [Thermoleophilia bacterium]
MLDQEKIKSDISDRKVAVLFATGFEDSELTEPVDALRQAGATVTLVGMNDADKTGVIGKHGTRVDADATIDEVRAKDFDALVIPGGRGPALLRKNERVLDFTREFDAGGKPLAAICHGPQVLASAGILQGRTATSFFTVGPEVKKAGARYVNKPVVVDGNLITSRMPRDIPAFIDAMMSALSEQPE